MSLIAHGKRQMTLSLLLALLLFIVYLHFARFFGDAFRLIGGAVVGLNLVYAGMGLVYRLSRHPFRRLDLGLADDRSIPGRAFELELHVEAKRAMTLKELMAELRCTRRAATQSDEIEVLHRDEKRVSENLRLEPGDDRHFTLELSVPDDAPYSFRDFQGRIMWTIRLQAEVADWGVLRDEFNVTVAPG